MKTITLLSGICILATLTALTSARPGIAAGPSDIDDGSEPIPIVVNALSTAALTFASGLTSNGCSLAITPQLISGFTPFDLACRMRVAPGVTSISSLEIVMWDGLGHVKNVNWLPGTIYITSGVPVGFTMPYPQGIDHPHGSEDAWILRARYTDQLGNRWRTTLCAFAVD